MTVATSVSSARAPRSFIASARIADLIAVDHLTGGIDGQAAVGVAVVRDAEVGAA